MLKDHVSHPGSVFRRTILDRSMIDLRAPICDPGESLSLDMLPGDVCVLVVDRVTYKLTEEDIWRIEAGQVLSDNIVNYYIHSAVAAANEEFSDTDRKVSRSLRVSD